MRYQAKPLVMMLPFFRPCVLVFDPIILVPFRHRRRPRTAPDEPETLFFFSSHKKSLTRSRAREKNNGVCLREIPIAFDEFSSANIPISIDKLSGTKVTERQVLVRVATEKRLFVLMLLKVSVSCCRVMSCLFVAIVLK